MRWLSTRSIAIASLLSAALGARLPLARRADSAHSTRLAFKNAADQYSFGVANKEGDGQTIYFVTVNVDGQDYAVVLDTGSADLWLDTTNVTFSSNVASTGYNDSLGYGDGTVAQGPVLIGEVRIGDFVVEKQAFITAPGTNATSVGDQGLLGVGPPGLSRINNSLANSSYNGAPLLSNLFGLYPNESNYITFMLNRSIFGVTDGGSFTIGEVDPDYAAILNTTQLPALTGSNQWITAMDSVMFNGQNLSGGGMLDNVTEKVPAQYEHKLLTLLDTGTALSTAPKSYVDAIYGSIPNVTLVSEDMGLYKVPCDTRLNVSMVLNGVQYPMNPLDLIQVTTDDDNVTVVCANVFSYSDPRLGADFILGDAFMRNVYSLFDFGSLTTVNDSAPFVQLLSITDQEQAYANFEAANQARVASFTSYVVDGQQNATNTTTPGDDTTSTVSPTTTLSTTPTASTSSSTSASGALQSPDVDAVAGALADSDDDSSLHDEYNTLKLNSYIIIGLLAGVIVLLLALLIMMISRSRQERKYSPLMHTGGPNYSSGKGSVYENPYDS
ncbi:hypothetical protein EIP91_003687 [Steccherinum ochraceum]|uniref:Peptidase A1 domain-containing protein n=1 Tax=Steccherinum ochraceum TaxID=92696 RepID=A0A4R0RA26_9APHY|nr:hypothetical protein EIP91_003687 [Steccherinum ochraceum]